MAVCQQRLNAPVVRAKPASDGGWTLELGDGATERFDGVVLACRAFQAADLISELDGDPARIAVTGPVRLIGPEVVSLSGGIAGFWLESTGGEGAASVEVTSARFAPIRVAIDVRG